MATVTYSVPSISGGGCVHTIQTEVDTLTGVQLLKANSVTKQVVVFDAPASEDQSKSLLAEINCPAVG